MIHQTATHKCYLFGSSAILKSRTDLANLKVRQRESPRLAKSWQPSNHHPLSAAITRHAQPHQPCFAAPLATLWGRSQTQKANLYSFAHLVCSCLLSMLWDRLLAANRRQTLVHAVLHPKVPRLGKSCKTKVEQNSNTAFKSILHGPRDCAVVFNKEVFVVEAKTRVGYFLNSGLCTFSRLCWWT